jgi:hypothetical protein
MQRLQGVGNESEVGELIEQTENSKIKLAEA